MVEGISFFEKETSGDNELDPSYLPMNVKQCPVEGGNNGAGLV